MERLFPIWALRRSFSGSNPDRRCLMSIYQESGFSSPEEPKAVESTIRELAKLRTQKGVSARDMSLSLGQANNYINNIENKKSLPAMQSFFYICEYLGVTPQEFFDEGNTCPEALREFIAEAKQLDSKSMQYILGIMKELNSRK